eukprot:465797-Prymnesium_polylepis.2
MASRVCASVGVTRAQGPNRVFVVCSYAQGGSGWIQCSTTSVQKEYILSGRLNLEDFRSR